MNININQKNILNRRLLILLLAVLGFSQIAISQSTKDMNPQINDVVPINTKLEKPFYPKFFISYSFMRAIGKFREGQYYSAPYPPDEIDYTGSDTYESSLPAMGVGFSFELGNIFWIRKLELKPQFKFAILAVYHDFQFIFNKENGSGENGIQYQAVKVGPLFSYNPIGALLIDVKATLEITADFEEGGAFLRTGVGMDLRYKRLSLGLDFCFGQEGFNSDVGYGAHHFSTSMMRVTFGLNFLPLKN